MLRVMSRRGDDRVTWDEQKAQAGDLDAAEAIKAAEAIFKKHVEDEGATAFRIDPGQPVIRINDFDALADQIVIVPRVVGG